MQTIKFKLLHPDAKLPQRAHATDAAFDVIATSVRYTPEYIEYGLGFATEIPAGWEGKVYARSSISNYDLSLCNSVAIIDQTYRGEWLCRFRPNFRIIEEPRFGEMADGGLNKRKSFTADKFYKVGDRIAQIQFQRVPEVRFEVVDEMNDSTRSAGGFGSTGA